MTRLRGMSWRRCSSTAPRVRGLRAEDIGPIYRRYVERFHPERGQESFDQAFMKRFSVREVPEDLNQNHELVVVASQFDATSERIVTYLAEVREVGSTRSFSGFSRTGIGSTSRGCGCAIRQRSSPTAVQRNGTSGTASSTHRCQGYRSRLGGRPASMDSSVAAVGGSTVRRCRC